MSEIATTHVGSLPRTQDVVDFIFAREREESFDPADFDQTMRAAVARTVAKQVAAGIDIVSDGETSKISYATYVKDRYTGFSGDSPRNAPADLKMFPGFLQRAFLSPCASAHALLPLVSCAFMVNSIKIDTMQGAPGSPKTFAVLRKHVQ